MRFVNGGVRHLTGGIGDWEVGLACRIEATTAQGLSPGAPKSCQSLRDASLKQAND